MTWSVVLFLVVASLVKIVPTCLPTGVVNKIMDKFSAHTKLNDQDTKVAFEGTSLNDEEKRLFITHFNEAIFMGKTYIYPGTEQLFLNPAEKGDLVLVETMQGKEAIKLYLYFYKDRIDVVKQGKKVSAYMLSSDWLHGRYFRKQKIS